jgi:UrcA family protein
MIRIGFRSFITASLLVVAAVSAHASAAEIVRVPIHHIDLHPATPAKARQVLARIDDAAQRACGGSGFDLREAQAALRASPCWQEAMDGAVRQIGDPLLTSTFVVAARR